MLKPTEWRGEEGGEEGERVGREMWEGEGEVVAPEEPLLALAPADPHARSIPPPKQRRCFTTVPGYAFTT